MSFDPTFDPGAEPPDDQSTGVEPIGYGVNSAGKLVIPQNMFGWLSQASSETGVPIEYLAPVVYARSQWNKITPQWVYQVAEKLATEHETVTRNKAAELDEVGGKNQPISNSALWLDSAAAAIGKRGADATTYKNLLASLGFDRGYTTGVDKALPTGKFVTPTFGDIGGATFGGAPATYRPPTIPGLDDDRADEVKAIADSVFLQYLGKRPSNDEYRDIAAKGMTRDEVVKWLRARPTDMPGVNLGQKVALVDMANRQAQDILGRDADQSEIDFLLTHKIPSNTDHISAFYEQIKDGAEWAGNPQLFRDTRAQLQKVWTNLGLTGDVPVGMVNGVVKGQKSVDQTASDFGQFPAPGFPEGVTVSEANRVRAIAKPFWEHYFPGEDPSTAHLVAMTGLPNPGIRDYIGSLPAQSRAGKIQPTPEPAGQPASQPQVQSPAPVQPKPMANVSAGTDIANPQIKDALDRAAKVS